MLELKNISVSLSINDRQLIDNFSFTLNRNDKAVIIGEEGNGKSTLLKLIYDESLIERYCDHSGRIIAKGKLAYLPQMIDEKYLDMTAEQYFNGCNIHEHIDIFNQLSIPLELRESKQLIHTMSGGEKVKIQLAKIIMEQPDILLLDEPTNDIDIETLEWMETFIKNSGLPILYVSHDETLIENTANIIIHIEQLIRKTKPRVTVAYGSYNEYIESRSAAFDKQMQIAKKQRSDYEAQMESWTQIYNRVDHELNTISRAKPGGGRLLKKKMKSVKAQEKRLERQAENFLDIPQVEEAILTAFDKSIRIPAGKTVLDFHLDRLCIADKTLSKNIKLKIIGSEHIGIIGKNGIGKSTLLKEIWLSIKERSDITACYMPQNYTESLDCNMTPIEYLAANYTKEDITKARTYMGAMKFTHEEMTGKISSLSGGQKAKILFLDMVLKSANVLILDEPTRNFSPLSNPVIRRTLSDFGGAVISISHDRKYLSEVCGKVYELTDEGLTIKYNI